jgi:hypothetical protein
MVMVRPWLCQTYFSQTYSSQTYFSQTYFSVDCESAGSESVDYESETGGCFPVMEGGNCARSVLTAWCARVRASFTKKVNDFLMYFN